MADATFDHELLEQIHQLNEVQKQQVLAFVRRLTQANRPTGESGKSLLKSIGLFESVDLDKMHSQSKKTASASTWMEMITSLGSR